MDTNMKMFLPDPYLYITTRAVFSKMMFGQLLSNDVWTSMFTIYLRFLCKIANLLRVSNVKGPLLSLSPLLQVSIKIVLRLCTRNQKLVDARHINHIKKSSSNTATTKPRLLSMLNSDINYDNVMDPTVSSATNSPFCTIPTVTPVPPSVTPTPVTPTPASPTTQPPTPVTPTPASPTTQPPLTPPKVTPSPPKSTTSPPIVVPAPPIFTPGPPIFLPPVVYPPPFGPPPPMSKQVLWCVAKPSVPDPIIQEAMDYACGSGGDCSLIKSSGPCYQPNTVISHASYAFNSYWQNLKETGATCDFGGAAVLVTKDPSYDNCHFKLASA
ncbi:extensin-like protein [Carex littledalei]|uniref:Extensin-like protein n=1 Tax=Carex littledalei TaxID=544730 RepID=A0A833VJQ0_9POAL|nr:extensin-like protein [Carex littledalei]